MYYTVNVTGNVEVIDIGITEEERRHFEEVDAIWEAMEAEENETQND